ncbi:MAG: hypothetical protein JAZ13_06320 [Candidatus Thiodiazotropha taylori]|nr:hypothetical protein [Candidatus Thiodiazotropha taylori]
MVMEYVASVKAAWEIAKAVKASTDAIDDAQIKLQVAELIGALADARIQAAESAELIASLEKQLKSKSEMKFNGTVYYNVSESGEQEGPWCPTCYDARHLEVRLQAWQRRDDPDNWVCRECKGYFR